MSSYESERRPVAVYEFAGSLAIESKKSNSRIYPLTLSLQMANSFYGARLQGVMVLVFIETLTPPVHHSLLARHRRN